MKKLLFRDSFVICCCLFLMSTAVSAQHRDRIWMFGGHAGIDFNDSLHPIPFHSQIPILSDGYSANISDYAGNLLFYSYIDSLGPSKLKLFNNDDSLMDNGGGIQGQVQAVPGNLILPTADTNIYYLLSLAPNAGHGDSFYYSIIDMSLNNGRGRVISKNNLMVNDYINLKFVAIKHANGRDWWVITQSGDTDQLFYKFLITQDTIINYTQYIGPLDNEYRGFGDLVCSKDGTKIANAGANCTLEVYDFDRCSGQLSNCVYIGDTALSMDCIYYGCSFSPSKRYLYVSTWYNNLYQFDLAASDIHASRQLIMNYPDTGVVHDLHFGQHVLGPDNRIYIGKLVNTASIMNTYYTRHLDVILDPDSGGQSCNYSSCYLDLGTGYSGMGLANFANYNLGSVPESICDSLNNKISDVILEDKYHVQVFPNPAHDKFSIHSNFSGEIEMKVVDQTSKTLLSRTIKNEQEIDISFLASGVYYLELKLGGELINRKLVVEH